MNINEKLRKLPSVDKLLSHPDIMELLKKFSHHDIVESLRKSLNTERKMILDVNDPENQQSQAERIVKNAKILILEMNRPSLRRVINATGIIAHTNLGRAILSEKAIAMAVEAARGYSNLEFDLEKGTRGHRNVHLKRHLIELTGAEDAMAVNNNAAAVLLLLDEFANGKEVIVSRGELIEIGGSFRLPDILEKSGAKLVEVGCTNKTYLRDYEEAITENTAILLKSHKSNYAIIGFSRETPGSDIAALAKKYNLIAAEDMGSGLMLDLSKYGLTGEETARELIESGLDLVTFSGDKMLGGPQCGIIVGRKELIGRMEKNPIARAFRLDKMTIAAMEGTLLLYRNPEKLEKDLPFLRMLAQKPAYIYERTGQMVEILKEKSGGVAKFKIIEGVSRVGGGAYPDKDIPTFLLKIEHKRLSPDSLYLALLSGNPPVVGRIFKDSLVIDLRTVPPEEENELAERILEEMNRI